MMRRRFNLVMMPARGMTGFGDFKLIADQIRSKCDDVIPYVINARRAPMLQALFWLHPTLYVGFYEARKFNPLRGRCLRGQDMGKTDQCLRMQACGIRIPRWASIQPGARYEPDEWGAYSVVKPNDGRMGKDVIIRRTARITYEKDCAGDLEHLIQQFIYTGPRPISYRALTLFGETLYLQKSTNIACGHELSGPQDLKALGGHNIVATAQRGKAELVTDEEVTAFAKEIALRAFPEIPVLGQDIVRCATTGDLYCLEVNPFGATWHFSSKTGLSIQATNSFNYEKQFNAFAKSADILINKTRELAI